MGNVFNAGLPNQPGGTATSSVITGYVQSSILTTSQSYPVPSGTKRIEALVVGTGGLAGVADQGGGGFGGAQVWEIPVTGSALDIVIGAGVATTVSSASMLYAAVGPGGVGAATGAAGKNGGSGGGGSSGNAGGPGAPPFCYGRLLWSAMDVCTRSGVAIGTTYTSNSTVIPVVLGLSGVSGIPPVDGALGWGGGGSGFSQTPGTGGGGTGGGTSAAAAGKTGGGGGGAAAGGGVGGTLASVSIWGFTGYAGGTASGIGGSGGGGLFGAGANTTTGAGGAGGLGGGGAGAGTGTPAGGGGAVVLRFYS